jgi:hypothetical protein
MRLYAKAPTLPHYPTTRYPNINYTLYTMHYIDPRPKHPPPSTLHPGTPGPGPGYTLPTSRLATAGQP